MTTLSIDSWRAAARGLSDLPSEDGVPSYVSNEWSFQRALPDAVKRIRSVSAYLGVGPEQNLTYVATFKPEIAILLDCRHECWLLHIMYKAIFGAADDRASFLNGLFGWSLDHLDRGGYLDDLRRSSAARDVDDVRARFAVTLQRSIEGFLQPTEQRAITDIHDRFLALGAQISSETALGKQELPHVPTFADLSAAADDAGQRWGFLASEAHYRVVRDLSRQNRLIPIIGDIASGPAVSRIGAFLREHGLALSVLYISNLEVILAGQGRWSSFVENLISLPAAPDAIVLRWNDTAPVDSFATLTGHTSSDPAERTDIPRGAVWFGHNLPKPHPEGGLAVTCLMVTERPASEAWASIHSYVKQTYPSRELVIVCTSPTHRDDYRHCIHQLARPDIRVLSATDGSMIPVVLLQIAMKGCSGNLFCQWDDDHESHPLRLAAQVEQLVKTGGDGCYLADFLCYVSAEQNLYWIDPSASPTPALLPRTLMCFRHVARMAMSTKERTFLQTTTSSKIAGIRSLGWLYLRVSPTIPADLDQAASHDAVVAHRDILIEAMSDYSVTGPITVRSRGDQLAYVVDAFECHRVPPQDT